MRRLVTLGVALAAILASVMFVQAEVQRRQRQEEEARVRRAFTKLWLMPPDPSDPDNRDFLTAYLRKGGNPHLRCESGQNLLMLAAFSGWPDAVAAALQSGIPVNSKDGRGGTALFWAGATGNPEVVKLLLRHGADVHAADLSEMTPLSYAACYGRTEMAELLIRHGVDVNRANLRGETPLMNAAAGNYGERSLATARLLLKHGADPRRRALSGKTAQDRAKEHGFQAMVRLLKQAEAAAERPKLQ